MSISFQYPNFKYIVNLKSTDRENYLTSLKNLYNSLKDSGFPVPSATLEGTGDETYVQTETKEGDFIAKLFQQGKIPQDKARSLSPRVSNIVDKIKSEKGISIYNTHTGNVLYNPSTDEIMLMDITQNSQNNQYTKVSKMSQQYLDVLKQKELLREEIDTLKKEIKALEEQKAEQDEDDEIQFTTEDQNTLDSKRSLLESKQNELASL